MGLSYSLDHTTSSEVRIKWCGQTSAVILSNPSSFTISIIPSQHLLWNNGTDEFHPCLSGKEEYLSLRSHPQLYCRYLVDRSAHSHPHSYIHPPRRSISPQWAKIGTLNFSATSIASFAKSHIHNDLPSSDNAGIPAFTIPSTSESPCPFSPCVMAPVLMTWMPAQAVLPYYAHNLHDPDSITRLSAGAHQPLRPPPCSSPGTCLYILF